MQVPLQVRLLGGVEVLVDGRFEPVSAAVERHLLAVLLLRAGSPVPAEVLLESVWGDDLRPGSRNNLQVHVGRLRKLLARVRDGHDGLPALLSRPGGYELQLVPDSLDVEVFVRLAARGAELLSTDPAGAGRLLERALELWRGPLLADVPYGAVLTADIARLEELRAAAAENRVAAALADGAPDNAVEPASRLVEEHPLRERPCELLMLSLHRSGRSVEALDAYRRFAERLDTELGLVPSPSLRDLHGDILRHASRLTPPQRRAAGRGRGASSPGTLFFGREAERADLSALLTKQETRVLTLTGAGGVGKTRLATECAADVAESFDAVAFVSPAEAGSFAAALSDVAAALGMSPGSGEDPASAVHHQLTGRRVLLVADDADRVPGVGAELAALAAAAPGLTVLATSTAPLRVAGEHVLPVAPLPVPEPGQAQRAFASALLLAERAARAGARIDPDDPWLAEVCRRCDGIPLALELAAPRLRIQSPQALAASLERPLGVLTGGPADLPPRRRSVRSLLAAAYDLLDDPDQQVLQMLPIFAGGSDAATIAQICRFGDDGDVVASLSRLVDAGLVEAVASPTGVRLTLLQTVREFATERATPGRLSDVRQRHSELFLALAAGCRPGADGVVPAETVAVLHAERGNLRAALRHAVEEGRWEAAGHAVLGAWGLWFAGGHIAEGRRRAAEVRAHCDGSLAVYLGVVEGALALYSFELDAAESLFRDALTPLLAAGSADWAARVQEALSTVHLLRGDLEAAEALATQALTTAAASGNARVLGRAQYQAGSVAAARGDADAAVGRFTEYLAVAQQTGSVRDAAIAHGCIAAHIGLSGDMAGARVHARAALHAARQARSDPDIAFALEVGGLVELIDGDPAAAEELYRQALAAGRGAGHEYRLDRVLDGLAAAMAHRSPATAVRLGAAAEARRHRHRGSSAWALLRERFAVLHDDARKALGEAGYAAAVTRGSTVSDAELAGELGLSAPWATMER